MSILRFRVTFDDYDDIQRDIDFQANHTFADLFNEILKSITFDNKHKGTFWLADHNWRKGAVIGSIQGEDESPLRKTELVDHIDDPHQKFLFTYDEEVKWNFNIELIRVMGNAEYRVTYPKISASTGIPPVQYKETLIIPTRERTEPDGRGRKPRAAKEEDEDELSTLLAKLHHDDEDDEEGPSEGEIELGEEPEADALELPADLDLETDSEIAKLAEEFNNTIETDGSAHGAEEEDESYGFGGDDEDEFGSEDDDEFGGGRSSYGGRDDYDE